jgi:hypothetical protein
MLAPQSERRCPDRALASRPWHHRHSHYGLQPPLLRRRPPPRAAIKGAHQTEAFPFSPPVQSCHPAHFALRSLPLPLFTDESHHPSTSSFVESTRMASLTLLHLATTCSPSRQSAMPPCECSPPLSSSSQNSPSTSGQARAVHAPSSSLAAH